MTPIRALGAGVSSAVLTFCLVLPAVVMAESKQHQVHEMSHHVMPFEMDATLHIFKMTEQGGIQQVVVRSSQNEAQIALIRQHLKHEAMRFQQGDYGDPATLHGESMPGLDLLQTGANAIDVRYSDLPDGGEIRFETSDLHLLTAIHRWFGAQLSEHGADARAE